MARRKSRDRITGGNSAVELLNRSTATPLIPEAFYAFEEVLRALGDGLMVTRGFLVNKVRKSSN